MPPTNPGEPPPPSEVFTAHAHAKEDFSLNLIEPQS
jgi:hypothetical protein